jgi:hypothetical protein
VTRINDIVNGRRGITADTAPRFARYFENSATYWMNLQTRYDLEVAEDEIAAKVARDVQPLEAATAREAQAMLILLAQLACPTGVLFFMAISCVHRACEGAFGLRSGRSARRRSSRK